MEGRPNFRIVGGASEEKKVHAQKSIKNRFFHHMDEWSPEAQEEITKFEFSKTPEYLECINFANEETNKLRKEAGLDPYDFPVDNFHFLPAKSFYKFAQSETSNAITLNNKHTVFVNMGNIKDNIVLLKSVIFHEMMHAKGHTAWEIEDYGDSFYKSLYRNGFSASSSQKKMKEGSDHSHFDGLNEAIVVEQEKRSVPERGEFSYKEQREVLNYICQEVARCLPGKYPSPEEVFKVFLNAHFSGKLLVVSRFTEQVFGKGSFRVLGNMKPDPESGILTLEFLKKNLIKN